jgi:hypothetical protein
MYLGVAYACSLKGYMMFGFTFEDCLNIDILIQNFVCVDRDFIILFCSLGGSISRNSSIL